MNGLSNFEYLALKVLEENKGFVVRHHVIEDKFYEMHDKNGLPRPESNVLQVIIGRVRRKGYPIKAVRGVGYILQKA